MEKGPEKVSTTPNLIESAAAAGKGAKLNSAQVNNNPPKQSPILF